MTTTEPALGGEPVQAVASSPAEIRVESIRCRSFRGLDDIALELDSKLTVLVGRNNAGKSRLLRALAVAVGAVPADKDDLTVGGLGEAIVDVVLAPSADGGEEVFAQRLSGSLGTARQTVSEAPLRERAGWRTTITRSAEGMAALTQRRVLRWNNVGGIFEPTGGEPPRELLRLVRGDLIETRRDLALELRERGSAAYRLIDDLEIDPTLVPDLQAKLDELSDSIVAGSGTLKGIKAALRDLSERVDAVGIPEVRPIPGRVNDLSTIASIEIADVNGDSLPLRLHGAGARSLASLRLQGVLYERRLGNDGGTLRPHAVTLVEEPEAHLHPQAQFDLPRLLGSIPGQVIVSTHSTHLVSELDAGLLRILTPRSGGAAATELRVVEDPDGATPRQLRPELYRSEMEKLRRTVERPFGELLFASVVVMGDGATERALLPTLLRHALGIKSHGLCVVDPGSMGDPSGVAVLKAARLLQIPWILFADSDDDGVNAVDALIKQITPDPTGQSELKLSSVVWAGGGAATEQMLVSFDDELCRAAASTVRPDIDTTDVLRALKALKGSAGRFLGEELIQRYPSVASWPQPLIELVDKVRDAVSPPVPADLLDPESAVDASAKP